LRFRSWTKLQKGDASTFCNSQVNFFQCCTSPPWTRVKSLTLSNFFWFRSGPTLTLKPNFEALSGNLCWLIFMVKFLNRKLIMYVHCRIQWVGLKNGNSTLWPCHFVKYLLTVVGDKQQETLDNWIFLWHNFWNIFLICICAYPLC
jgi:hypothetical protein